MTPSKFDFLSDQENLVAVLDICTETLSRVAPAELDLLSSDDGELDLLSLGKLVDLAREEEVMVVSRFAPAGGFGSIDLIAFVVVPVVVNVLSEVLIALGQRTIKGSQYIQAKPQSKNAGQD